MTLEPSGRSGTTSSKPLIGVLACELEGQPTGVGRYLEGLLDSCLQQSTDFDWILFFKGDSSEHPLLARHANLRSHFDLHSAWTPMWWEQLRLPKVLGRYSLDAFFSPGYSLPPRLQPPGLVTIHDLSFEHYPEEFNVRERWRRRFLARRAARSAARILTDSPSIAADIQHCYRVPSERLRVVPLAVDRAFAEPNLGAAGSGFHKPYLLAVGTILPRRNIDLLISAYRQLLSRDHDLDLVLVGANRLPRANQLEMWIEGSGLGSRIHHLDYVSDAELSSLYRSAELTCYLSSYEGFGLPPLESLSLGTPALVMPGLYLDELWPDYPFVCRSATASDIAEQLELALSDRVRLRQVAEIGASKTRSLTWDASAKLFLEELAAMNRDPLR